MAGHEDEDGIGEGPERQSDQNELQPDAIAQDGVLSLLTAPGDSRHHRTLSAGSRAQLNTQDFQLQFNKNRLALEHQLSDLMGLLEDLLMFNKNGQIEVPTDTKLAVLQIDLKLGASSVIVGTPSQHLIESKIDQVVKHAAKLRSRLRNTDSHVLVTGDLNAGKSSLCNALLRRSILPVDQQPCTDVFCEVLDSAKNQGTEEVHAVFLNKNYDITDPSTHEKFSLSQLVSLVHQSDKYKLLRVYLKDPRPPQQSLLANGVVDICLIDAPGLNVSEVKTTELFGRQEEIDLVIFVVSAENHFTQSAREFVADTAQEKSLVFIAVNNYDKIRDKKRCRDRVMNQVADVAPETHKGAGDFVHFVSSSPPDSGPGGGDNDDNNGPGSPDFDRLEASLRNFVLERRSASKLAPARTYLLNVLKDLTLIAHHNTSQASTEQRELVTMIHELEPTIDKTVGEYAAVSEKIDRDTERLCHSLLENTESYLTQAVNTIGDEPVTEYTGLLNVFAYAAETRDILVQRIQQSVVDCEEKARQATASAVDSIKQLGILHVGEQPAFSKVFQQSAMFSRRKDNLGKHITAEFTLFDALDLTTLLERPMPVLNSSKRALVSAATSTTSAGSAVGGAITALSLYQSTGISTVAKVQQVVGTKRLLIPVAVLAVVGLGAWVVHELPRTIARKLARKIAFEVDELGYVRSNAERISGECRKVLRYPAQDVRSAFQSQLESRTRQREELERHIRDTEEALSVFTDIEERATVSLDAAKQLDLH